MGNSLETKNMNAKLDTSNRDDVQLTVVQILEDMTKDWEHGLTGPITAETGLMADLGFESIDMVMLIVAIEERFGRKGFPFEQLFMTEGRYVEELSVGTVAEFLHRQLNG